MDVAAAFGHTFWWAAAIIGLALIPALLLPRRKPAPVDAGAAPAPAEGPALVEV